MCRLDCEQVRNDEINKLMPTTSILFIGSNWPNEELLSNQNRWVVEFTYLGHIATGVYLDNGTVLLMGKVVYLLSNLLGLKFLH